MQQMMILEKLKENAIVSMHEIEEEVKLSSRAIRTILKNLKLDGAHHGFEIETIRAKGYKLHVLDDTLFNSYMQDIHQDVYAGGKQIRVPRILYILLQQNNFISIQKICESLMVSRNTLLKDLSEIKEYLSEFSLTLESKSHYGIRIIGDEKNMRRAFSKYVVNSKDYTMVTKQYFEYIENLEVKELEGYLHTLMEEEGLMVTQVSFDSIVDHLKVLLFRATQQNFISDMENSGNSLDEIYYLLSTKIVKWVENHYQIQIPQIEIDYLASQIAGKTSVAEIPKEYKKDLENQITKILTSIDEEFLTDFENDQILKEALLMHMYPLLMRIAHKIELNNPLVEFVSSRYANVFLVALRFLELWNEDYEVDLSQDEVGYMALHFAGHLERSKQQAIASYKRILIISELGRGNVLLIRQKLETVFTNAVISYDYIVDEDEINMTKPDLILSTIQLNEKHLVAPLIYIKEMLDDNAITNIKDILILKSNINKNIERNNLLKELFSEDIFTISHATDYIETIQNMATQMVDLGYADKDFPELVIERERKFTTVYENGVAGPHGMLLNAIKESIGVVIVKEPMTYQKKHIKVIFLINIHKGNLFLYREISKFLQEIISDYSIVSKLELVQGYNEFQEIIKNIKY